MNNRLFHLFFTTAAIVFFLLSGGCSGHRPEATNPVKVPIPAVGEQLPDMVLSAPEEASIRTYLGLPETADRTIRPGDIDCEILLIEIFSMYCPYCQHEAPTVNQLYDLIQQDRKIADRIRIIGIGIGNSAYEVSIFREKYQVKFPLFADDNYVIFKDIGQVRTPFFIAIHNRGARKNQIFYAKCGSFGDSKDFLHALLDLAGR